VICHEERDEVKVFVGFGYNVRDQWIEEMVFPILENMGFSVVHGRDLHGDILQPEVQHRIDQSDAAVGFFTLRDGQDAADFNSHIWVRDEMVHANAKGKPIVPVQENGVRFPHGLLGDRMFIPLSQDNRLACVVELVRALGRRNIRRIKLEPEEGPLRRDLNAWRRNAAFEIRYRSQDPAGVESNYQVGRMELIDQGFYLNMADVPRRAYVEVEGLMNGDVKFSSGWVSADAVQVRIS
jgi:hypothetical protein